jgi:hypothetical protein
VETVGGEVMYISNEIESLIEKVEEIQIEIPFKCQRIPGNTAKQTLYSDLDNRLTDAVTALEKAYDAAAKISGE